MTATDQVLARPDPSPAPSRAAAVSQPGPEVGAQPRQLLVVRTLLALAALAVWLLSYTFGLSMLHEHHAQRVLYSTFREQLAEATAPLGGTVRDGVPVALITAPGAGLHGVVAVQGTTSGDLEAGPGHLPGTSLPGQAGTSTFMGRAVAFGAPFRHLTSLRPGAVITVTTDQGVFHYTVRDVRGPGDPLPSALLPGSGRLTLITAANTGWRDLWAPTHAVYVDASLEGKPQPTVAMVATSSDADEPMRGEGAAALVPLVLWLQALVLCVLIAVWAQIRWGARQTWLVGTPVVIATLWGVSGVFMQLLPNLL